MVLYTGNKRYASLNSYEASLMEARKSYHKTHIPSLCRNNSYFCMVPQPYKTLARLCQAPSIRILKATGKYVEAIASTSWH
jgi:hypothetical protein